MMLRSTLLSLGLWLLSALPAEAAPQILGIVASNGLPTPLHCAEGRCSAYVPSFCLQEARYAPDMGSEYRLARGELTLIARRANGETLRLTGDGLLTIQARFGFTTLQVSLPAARLAALGATSAELEVGAGTSVIPKAYAGDPQPQSADEVALATGPLRQVASHTFDRPGGPADTARLVELVINRMAEPTASLTSVWSQVAREARGSGIATPGIEAAGAVVAECQGSAHGADSLVGGLCLEMRQTELMTDLTRSFWDQAAGGS
jgi:hypothetical protein